MTPRGPSSWYRDSDNPTTANLAAVYTAAPGSAYRPASEATFTT
jgi:hypothetical protein